MRPTIERPPFPNDLSGGFCHDTDPVSKWTVTVADDSKTMRLDPVAKDPCGDRVAVLQGTWTRLH